MQSLYCSKLILTTYNTRLLTESKRKNASVLKNILIHNIQLFIFLIFIYRNIYNFSFQNFFNLVILCANNVVIWTLLLSNDVMSVLALLFQAWLKLEAAACWGPPAAWFSQKLGCGAPATSRSLKELIKQVSYFFSCQVPVGSCGLGWRGQWVYNMQGLKLHG